VVGPVDVQAEYLGAHTDAGNLSGLYAQAGWWITGEHQNYDESMAFFGRVKPKNNFDPAKAPGAGGWSTHGTRHRSERDTVKGGKVNDVSVGLNWQLNPNMRVMLDGIHSMPKDEAPRTSS